MTTKVCVSWALTRYNFNVSVLEVPAFVIRVGEIAEDGNLDILFMSK